MIESILPKNEEHWLELRKKDITSTEVSSLFNCSPYATRFELWHRKKKDLPSNFEANERTDWGLFLQDGIAAKFARDNNWKITRKLHYIRDSELRIGSSFDFDLEESTPIEYNSNIFNIQFGLSEVKNVDSLIFKQGWIVDYDYIEAPPHIELQVQHQMLVSKLPFNYILVLVGGNRGYILKRYPNKNIFEAIIRECKLFWDSIENNIEPKPFDVDAEFISQLYNKTEKGKIFDARGNETIFELSKQYKEYQQEESLASTNKKIIKSRILPLIGEAEKVIVDGGYSISCGNIGECEIPATTRSGYRRFSINCKEE